MNGESRKDGEDRVTSADVEAMKLWTELGTLVPQGGADVNSTYSAGRIIIPATTAEAAREVEERARACEECHAEGRARILRAMGGSLYLSNAVGLGPWASPMRESSAEEIGDPREDGGEEWPR